MAGETFESTQRLRINPEATEKSSAAAAARFHINRSRKCFSFFFLLVSYRARSYLADLSLPRRITDSSRAERNPRRGIMYNYPARKSVRPLRHNWSIAGATAVALGFYFFNFFSFFINLRRALYKQSDPRLELILKRRTDSRL